MNKPKLTKEGFIWTCQSGKFAGYGTTPAKAYKNFSEHVKRFNEFFKQSK